MKKLPLIFLCCIGWSSRSESLPQSYAEKGELIITGLASAPFPHPKRAEGHKYKDQFYPAKEHYADNTVAMFIPKGFRETGRIDFVVHFHGWNNHVEGVLRHYKLIEQLIESGRNAILVVPQGPREASDSFGGKLEDPDGFNKFMKEVSDTLRQRSSLKKKDFAIGNIVLSAHSGGYQVVASILDRGGLNEHVKEVWLFDALYAQTDRFLAWSDKGGRRLINIYTEHGGTKGETEQMMATLKQRGSAFLMGRESEMESSRLRTNDLIFLYSDLAHNEVIDRHSTFRNFLRTSCLNEARQDTSP